MSCCGKSKLKKLGNIAKGFKSLARGEKYEFTDSRIDICRECDKNYWIKRTLWCGHCKCFVPAKARVKDEKCPLNKWNS